MLHPLTTISFPFGTPGPITNPAGGAGVSDGDKGDIVVSGSGAVWTIDNGVVTAAKTSITGTPTGAKYLRDDWSWQAVAGGGLSDADYGDITVSGGATVFTIDAGVVTLAKMANMATASLIYRKTAGSGAPEVNTLATLKTDLLLSGTNSGDQTITLTGDVTGSGTGSFAATIANDAVTYAKMQNVSATSRFIGRITAGAGDPEELTGTQATTLLDNFTSTLKGLAPLSGGGTTNFLRADGTWAAPSGGAGLTHDQVMARNVFGGPY